MKRSKISELLHSDTLDKTVHIKGWVRTFRSNRFIALNDGSTLHNLQAVVDFENTDTDLLQKINTGASLSITGKLVLSAGKGQRVEIQVETLEVLGESDPDIYPLQPKKHSMEFLREKAHLRTRTTTMSSVMRVRHGLAFAIHEYFNKEGFYYMNTPIITASDAEGAGETFRVTTFDLDNFPKTEDQKPDFQQDFFGKAVNLTVSGQLEAEVGALSMGAVYTFGPTFRAENSNTTRHLAEFWMVEPEVAFADLQEDAQLAEDFLKYIIRYVLEKYPDDLALLENRLLDEEKTKPAKDRNQLALREKLEFIVNTDFEQITYTEAIRILRNSKPHKKKRFKYMVEWGIDLQTEHERYLVEKHFKKPVIIVDYPQDIKAFYMKQNQPDAEGRKTVAAMDILFPAIGEIVGGSQREDNETKLRQRMQEMNIPEEDLWWYLELRKFGTAPHAGFGLGFERIVQFVTGISNIRDVIPFPRTPKNANF